MTSSTKLTLKKQCDRVSLKKKKITPKESHDILSELMTFSGWAASTAIPGHAVTWGPQASGQTHRTELHGVSRMSSWVKGVLVRPACLQTGFGSERAWAGIEERGETHKPLRCPAEEGGVDKQTSVPGKPASGIRAKQVRLPRSSASASQPCSETDAPMAGRSQKSSSHTPESRC